MRVRRVNGWARSADLGGFVPAGDVVEMDDALAALHIRNGDAVALALEPVADDAGESVGDALPPDGAATARPTIEDVTALRRKEDALEMAASLGVELDATDSLKDMKAALALALEPVADDAPDAGESGEEKD